MEGPENDRMHSNYGALGEEETTEETRTKIIEADHDSRDQAGETNSTTEQPQDAQEAETEDDANTENHENEEENDEEGNDESNDESDSENSEEVVDDDDTTLEREETQESQQDDNEGQATASATNDYRHTFPMGVEKTRIKPPRVELTNALTSIPSVLKRRYISTPIARQIIPSETTNPSSDAGIEREIHVRRTPEHSPLSSPPQDTPRREGSPKKRRMTTRSTTT
ncbi:hypothetical protein V2A60_008451 [Cordyceps javanica]